MSRHRQPDPTEPFRIKHRGITLRSDAGLVTCETCGRYIANADDLDTLTAAITAHLSSYHVPPTPTRPDVPRVSQP